MSGTRQFERRDWLYMASLLLMGALALGYFALTARGLTGGLPGAPLDDAWIHFQFARNVARGDGLSFNPGLPTSGSTAPLWTLILAVVYSLGGKFPVAGQITSAVCMLAVLIASYALGRRLTRSRWAGWLGSAIIATNGRVVWAGLSALETTLFAALSVIAINAHLTDRGTDRYRLRTAVLFGLAALARPEGYLLFPLALADFLFSRTRNRVLPGRPWWRDLPLAPGALFIGIVSPYLLFSLRTSGHLLPNTYHAKAIINLVPNLDFLSLAARYLILDNPIMLPFFALGWIVCLRRFPLLSAWTAGLPIFYAFLHAVLYQHGRYLIPLIPCNALVGLVGLLEAHRLAKRRGWSWTGSQITLAIITAIAVIAGTAWRLPVMANLFGQNVANINQMHVALANWVVENTAPTDLLALNDIGAITYISERPLVDLAGLVTPEVIPILAEPNRDVLLAEFLAKQDVAYVIIFPAWFPDLASRKDVLEPVHRVTLEHNTIAGGNQMVVYRTNWRTQNEHGTIDN